MHIPDPEVGDYRVTREYAAPDGSYRIDGLPYGDYLLWFNEQMMVPNLPLWYEDDPFSVAPTTVTVGPSGTRPSSVDAALPMPSHIRGVVHGLSGGGTLPLQNAWVSALVSDPAVAGGGWEDSPGCTTDAKGAYDLALPAGTYWLQFVGPGGAWGAEFWNDVADFSLATTILVGEEATLTGYDAVLAPAGP